MSSSFCPGDQCRQRIAQKSSRRLKHLISSQPLTFGQKQMIFLTKGRVLVQVVPLLSFLILLLMLTLFWATGRLVFDSPSASFLIFLCDAVIYCYFSIGLTIVMIFLQDHVRVKLLPETLEEDLRTFGLGSIRKSNRILESFTKGAYVPSMPKVQL